MLGLLFCVWAFSSCSSGGHSSSRCAGLSLSRPLPSRSTGSRRAGSAVVAHGPSCSAACGIFPDQGSNPCSLHWQADFQPLRHQGSPKCCTLKDHSKVLHPIFVYRLGSLISVNEAGNFSSYLISTQLKANPITHSSVLNMYIFLQHHPTSILFQTPRLSSWTNKNPF